MSIVKLLVQRIIRAFKVYYHQKVVS
ncbi:hypothetical protein MXB_4474 [Myxobolus squamalis]|nr:hypothetical protein MXB_4474 [Myxobolus squamalis]